VDLMPRTAKRFYDPSGRRYGLPTYPWKMAPDGLATLRQLAERGLRPGGKPIVAQLMWSRGRGKVAVAYLYAIDGAAPKRKPTAGNRRAVAAMLRARSTCRFCAQVFEYCLPRHNGRLCLECAKAGAQ
jgi:hypothetical protein